MIPSRVLAQLERVLRRVGALEEHDAPTARRAKTFIVLTILAYKMRSMQKRAGKYLSRNVRFRGIWNNWRDAGLDHLDDRAMIRFCGFPKEIVFTIAQGVGEDPAMASLRPGSRYWKRLDPRARPTCDVLDVVVLVLREIATTGYQHTLASDMASTRGFWASTSCAARRRCSSSSSRTTRRAWACCRKNSARRRTPRSRRSTGLARAPASSFRTQSTGP